MQSCGMPRPSAGRLVALLVLGGMLLRLVLAAVLPPGYDEAYYLFYGQHLDLSFFDHPPAVGLFAWLGVHLGGSILALRLASLLSYSAALVLLASATRRWFGPSASVLAVLIASLSPLLLLCGGVLLLPDAPLLLLLAALLWWLSRHPSAVPETAPQALQLGLILGGLTLCKYHALLVLVSLLAYALTQPQASVRFRQPWPWLALLIWGLSSSPLWIWNQAHGWTSFVFHAGRTDAESGFHWLGPPLFLLAQLGLLFPCIGLVLLLALCGRSEPGDPRQGPRRLLRWLVLPQLVLFCLLAGRMHVLASWLVPAWWMTLPLAAAWLRDRLGQGRRRYRLAMATSQLIVPLLLAVGALQVRWGVLDRWLPPGLDASAQLMPVQELRRSLQAHPAIWRQLREAELISSTRYDLPGFLALALGRDTRAAFTTFSRDPRGFRVWQPRDGYQGRRGVLFSIHDPNKPLTSRRFPSAVGPLQPLGLIVVHRAGKPALTLEFSGFGPLRGPFPRPGSA